MKLITGILAVAVMTGAAWGQNPDAIDNARSVAKSLQQIKTNQSNAALEAAGVPAQQADKPVAGLPAPAVKVATIPGAKPAQAAAKPVRASNQNNTLERVHVVHHADDIQIEISSREAVTPKISKLSSPARVIVELPATAMAAAQNKIPVNSAGVKDVRIGMDGKTPPTTSIVVDLEQAYRYEVTPGPGNMLILTLHTQAVAKNTPAPVPAQPSAPAPKLQSVAAKPVASPAATASTAKSKAAPMAAAVKPHDAFAPKPKAVAAAKLAATKPASKAETKPAVATGKTVAEEKPAATGKIGEAAKAPKPEEKKWAMSGKRDPFFSPVLQQSSGSGCSTGKKCLEIGQINVRGVVKSESGFIAVVTNSLNKAYFLHESDPVFNGYVVRITGDSVVFQETFQDKLGKSLTREVVKRILTPAV
jgi:Tfp pilus assembly protein PilP